MAVRGPVASVCMALALAMAASANGESDRACAGTPALRLVDSQPVKLRGTGFCARERLRVRAQAGETSRARRVRADASGRFDVRFKALDHDQCAASLSASAWSSGDLRADLKRPRRLCPVPLSPS